MSHDLKVFKKASTFPDEVYFTDEDGNELEDWGTMKLDADHKLLIAGYSIKWKQSFETTFARLIGKAIREYSDRHNELIGSAVPLEIPVDFDPED